VIFQKGHIYLAAPAFLSGAGAKSNRATFWRKRFS